jgi:hypothetical protein
MEDKIGMTNEATSGREMIRHAVATMVYRGAKTFRDAPADFSTFRVRPESRTPIEIIAHMGDLFDWALSMARGQEVWRTSTPLEWDREIDRFYASVKEFDAFFASPSTVACPMERLLQGPILDATTHVGQLAMLRHIFGAPIKGENYFKADIRIGQVGPDQPARTKNFN